jgi:predicted nucleotidyltransferase
MSQLDVKPQDLATVKAILRTHVPEFEVRAFGSRVRGKRRKFSDLDLVIMTDEPLNASRMAVLCDAFSESDLPFKVDVLDWAATSTTFRRIIEGGYEIIALDSSAYASLKK